MESILKFENREHLFGFLFDFGVKKISEKYDPQNFGNFYVVLSAPNFFLRYVNDRSHLTIEAAAESDPDNWIDLSFIKDFIYDPENINSGKEGLSNSTRLKQLNDFLKQDFSLLINWFKNENYIENKGKLEELLREKFKKKFPGAVEE